MSQQGKTMGGGLPFGRRFLLLSGVASAAGLAMADSQVAAADGPGGTMLYRGAWQPTTMYAINDVVTYAGGMYIAVASLQSGSVFDLNGWTQLVPQTNAFVPVVAGQSANGSYRSPRPLGPVDLSSILTPAIDPYGPWDGLTNVVAFDLSWVIIGEDGQVHVMSKIDQSTFRADRAPNWNALSPWNVSPATLVSGFANEGPGPFLRGAAKETWTYADPGLSGAITTGYAVIVGTGDEISAGNYFPPTVWWYREGASAAQSLTSMVSAAGIMGGTFSTPRCLQGVSRISSDTFFLYGAGVNQSTNLDASRPTFGKLILNLNGSKTQTAPTAVSSLTWTDYLSALQGVMPSGENIINVPACADQLVSDVLFVMCVTYDGTSYRARLVQYRVPDATATLDGLNDALGRVVSPLTPNTSRTIQAASIQVGSNGILWYVNGTGGNNYAYYRGWSETAWRNVINQINRALAGNGSGVNGITWDATNSRFVVFGGFQSQGCVGWLDANCYQGHPLTAALPLPMRFPADNARNMVSGVADSAGVIGVGDRQMVVLLPFNSIEESPNRVLWGCRVTPTTSNDQVQISEGEVLIFHPDNPPSSAPQRVYIAGGSTIGGLRGTGNAYTIVLTRNGVVQRPGNGWASGGDIWEPALPGQVILATIKRVGSGVPITTGEIDQSTFRETGWLVY